MKMKTVVGVLVAVSTSVILAATVATKCRYCGMASYGRGCQHAPGKVHRHGDADARCEYCGFQSYGRGCVYAPNKVHVHGSGNGKCIYCGNKGMGKGCVYAPDGVHVK